MSDASEESAWNTLWRIDHQLNPKHTWAFRWLREVAPQFNRFDGDTETKDSYNDETDLDQTLVATVTSVLTDTKVNTFRAGWYARRHRSLQSGLARAEARIRALRALPG